MLLWEPFCCITNVLIDLELQGFIQSPFSDFSFSNVRFFFFGFFTPLWQQTEYFGVWNIWDRLGLWEAHFYEQFLTIYRPNISQKIGKTTYRLINNENNQPLQLYITLNNYNLVCRARGTYIYIHTSTTQKPANCLRGPL